MASELQQDLNELKAFLQALDFEVDGKMIKTVEACIALASLPVEGDEWISVEDRLPERTAIGYDAFYGRIGVCYKEDGRLVLIDSDDCLITHWMPFPSPPKPTANTDRP